VSDHDDLPFVAAPGGAIILPARNLDLWAEALRALYDDPARVNAMGRASREFARRLHAPEVNIAKREYVYDAVQ
jgi:glycosyltransferase involved in cell wall biosynthesis